jgi:hypothetical protein
MNTRERAEVVEYVHDVIMDDAETLEEVRQAVTNYYIDLMDKAEAEEKT